MKKLNIVFSVVLIAVAAFFFFYADTFKMLPGQTEIGPGAFPKAVCVGLAVCGVLLIIQELRKGGSEKAELFSKKLLIGIAAANQATKKAAATANGLTGLFGYASTVVSGVGLGFVAQHYGWNWAYVGIIGVAVVGMLVFLMMWGARADGYDAEPERN